MTKTHQEKNLISIKEYAEQNNITVQAVYKKIKLKQIKCVVANGKKFIKVSANKKQTHADQFCTNENNNKQSTDANANDLVELLKQQLAEKDKQIENLTQANNGLTTLLAMKEQQVLQLTYKPTLKDKLNNLFKKNNDANN